jgi:hypothetical protein
MAHFPGGLVGEGHREDFVSASATYRNEMRDPGGEDAGFAHACAGKNENGPVQRLDRLPLLFIQPVEVGRISVVRATDERPWASGIARRRLRLDAGRFGCFGALRHESNHAPASQAAQPERRKLGLLKP